MFTHKLFQLYQLQTTLLYLALFGRWLVLMPLVGSRYLPGGIHEYLCYLLVIVSVFEVLWSLYFHGVRGFISQRVLKSLNYLYLVLNLHFYDDYEHAPLLKTSAYSTFIIGVSLVESYQHWCRLFKRGPNYKRETRYWKFISYVMLPCLYLSEFVLLLLNRQLPNHHTTEQLELVNTVVLILYFPMALTVYKRHLQVN